VRKYGIYLISKNKKRAEIIEAAGRVTVTRHIHLERDGVWRYRKLTNNTTILMKEYAL